MQTETVKAPDHIENLHKLGADLADRSVQTIIDSGDIGAFKSVIENLSGERYFTDGFMGRLADLAAAGLEAENKNG